MNELSRSYIEACKDRSKHTNGEDAEEEAETCAVEVC